jgi:TPR repeat protein
MKKLILMLAMTLALTLTANMARADDFDDARAAYYDGDYATAFKLIKPLAEQGDASAQFNLGVMYAKGEGVIENDKKAVKWFRLAAEQGDAEAQNNLGTMYHNGEGVLQDNKKAHMWYNIARANGEKEHAADNIERLTGGIFSRMAPADISEAQDMAERCLASNYQDC